MTGGMTNLHPFIRGSLERSFSELFFSDASLWSQYKFIASNIFSCRIFIITCKILTITVISNKNKWINYIFKIILKRHSTLQTRASFVMSSAEKIDSVRKLKIKFSRESRMCEATELIFIGKKYHNSNVIKVLCILEDF